MTERLIREGVGGPIYRVRLCPRELRGGGIDPAANAVVFEDILGGAPRITTINADVELVDLDDWDLECLLGATE